MAIWSLTTERVEKLLRQIGDKEMEIDALLKLSPKDIWKMDLDAFVEEWNTQLDEEAKRAKKIANTGRRASHKLGIAPSKGKKKKRKMDDNDSDDSGSDFGPVKKKAKPKTGGLLSYLHKEDEPKKPSATAALKGGAALGSTATKQAGMLGYLKKAAPKEIPLDSDSAMDVDEPAPVSAPAAATKKSRPAAKNVKKPAAKPDPVDSESDSDVFAAVAKEAEKKPAETITTSRTARGAAKKATNYVVDNDSESDSMGDDLLDVSTMVKTIGGSSNDRPLFSTARPGSGSGARPNSATGATSKARAGAQKSSPIDLDDDVTNYEGLMPQGSPHKPAPRNVNDTIMGSDDDDDFGFGIKKSKPAAKPVAKAAPKAKPAPKSKAAPAAVVAKKTTQLSPAAKAYAARLGKAKDLAAPKAAPKAAAKPKQPITIESDDEMEDADQLANELLSDDDEPTPKPAAARPGRRAAARPAKYVVSDDEESDEASEPSFEEDESE